MPPVFVVWKCLAYVRFTFPLLKWKCFCNVRWKLLQVRGVRILDTSNTSRRVLAGRFYPQRSFTLRRIRSFRMFKTTDNRTIKYASAAGYVNCRASPQGMRFWVGFFAWRRSGAKKRDTSKPPRRKCRLAGCMLTELERCWCKINMSL